MKKATGWQPTRGFQHRAKIRRQPGGESGLRLSAWETIAARSGRVDTARANWAIAGGLMGVQSRCGMFDPRPRLVKHSEGGGGR